MNAVRLFGCPVYGGWGRRFSARVFPISNILIANWRDKRGHELDFVLADRGQPPTAIECKLSPDEFNPAGLKAFRRRYPHGDSFVVAPDIESPFLRRFSSAEATFVSLPELNRKLLVHDDSQGENH